MKTAVRRAALAYSGGLDTSIIIPWLKENYRCEVVAVAVDVGQREETRGLAEKARATGAADFRLIDARDEFARDCILPALRHRTFDASSPALAHPLLARKLADVAAIEHATALAHGGSGTALHAAIAAIAGGAAVLAPVAEWSAGGVDPRAFARAHGVHVAPESPVDRAPRNLIVRRAPSRVAAPDAAAHVDLAFAGGVPVAINAVALALPELIDSLSLIAAQHGIAGAADVHAPAADVLQAAYAALHGDTGEVRLRLLNGEHAVLAVNDRISQVVIHA